jgi:hypothetical protein
MKIAAITCFCVALFLELYGVWGLLQTAKRARVILLTGKPSMVELHGAQEGLLDYNISESGRFPAEEAALEALATPRLAIAAVVAGIFAGFAGNLLSL